MQMSDFMNFFSISATTFYKAQPVMDFALDYLNMNIRYAYSRCLCDQDRLKVCAMVALHPQLNFLCAQNWWLHYCVLFLCFHYIVAKESP